ncbi:MAG: hypothetical protein IJT88_09535 [Kiritimatiellae bacterium]|nr:hypothetical protein [Kiritimatiellia bacterium]
MAGMNVSGSLLGSGIVVLSLKEYEARVKELDYAFEQLNAHEAQSRQMADEIKEMRGEVEGLKQDKDATSDYLVSCFEALTKIKAIAQEILGAVSARYMHGKAAEIEKLCDDGLLNRIENKEGEEG